MEQRITPITGTSPAVARTRRVRLGASMAQELWSLRKGASDDALVFTAERGARLNPSNLVSRVLKPAAKRAGLDWVTPHSFRHSCASILFRSGMNAKQVSGWLGHSDAGFTLRTYVHLLPEDLPEPDAAFAFVGNGAVDGRLLTGTTEGQPDIQIQPEVALAPLSLSPLSLQAVSN